MPTEPTVIVVACLTPAWLIVLGGALSAMTGLLLLVERLATLPARVRAKREQWEAKRAAARAQRVRHDRLIDELATTTGGPDDEKREYTTARGPRRP